MIGIAISVYDKFEDVKVLADIVKNNWEEDYYLVVCSAHPDAQEELKNTEIDELILGPDIDYDPSMEGYKSDIHLISRILGSIKLGCKSAIDTGCSYVMHVHADAWVLDESKFNQVVEQMGKKDKKVAGKGSLTLRHKNQKLGGVSDMYIIFDTTYAEETGLFDFNPLDLMPHYLERDALLMRIIGKVGRSNLWIYFDYSQDEFWDGRRRADWEKGTVPHIRPMGYNPNLGFLHVNTDDFLDNDGRKVQAMYLNKHDLTEGDNISKFLEKYLVPRSELLQELSRKERALNKGLRWVGIFSPEKYGYNRNFIHKAEVLNEPKHRKLLRLCRNLARFIYFKSHKSFFRLPFTEHILPENKQTFQRDLQRQHYYMDSEYPRTDKEIYAENVDLNGFPSKYRDVWFDEY